VQSLAQVSHMKKTMERRCNDEDIASFLAHQKKKTKKRATSTRSF
jgi:hypothetical protein